MMMRRSIVATIALLAFLPIAAQSQHATADTAASNSVHRAVQREVDGGRLMHRDTTIACTEDEPEIGVRLLVDDAGRIRRLVINGDTGDHGDETAYDYDLGGTLRYASAERGAINGTEQEERVWYSSTGAVLLRRRRITHGPGYPFGQIQTIPDARRWRASLCEG
jgi:hypothetical protein